MKKLLLRENLPRNYLLLASFTLMTVALVYGLYPDSTIPKFLEMESLTTDTRHIFRAVMGLYLATSAYWFISAFNLSLQLPSIISVILFNTGLASGRIMSIIIDGKPSGLLLLFLILEMFGIVLGLYVWFNQRRNQ